MQIHTRKLRNTFSIWQSTNSVLTREINHPIQTSLNTESTYTNSSTNFDHFQPVSKWFEKAIHLPLPSPLFSSAKSETNSKRVSPRCSLARPCVSPCVWNNVSTLSGSGARAIVQEYIRGVFSRRRQPTRETTPANPPYPIRGDASSSSRSCRAFQITGISARVGINIEIFLLSDEPPVLENLPFFFRVPSTNFLLFFFVPVRVVWKDRWIVGAWRFKWFLIKRCRSFFSLFFIVVIFFTLFIGSFFLGGGRRVELICFQVTLG